MEDLRGHPQMGQDFVDGVLELADLRSVGFSPVELPRPSSSEKFARGGERAESGSGVVFRGIFRGPLFCNMLISLA